MLHRSIVVGDNHILHNWDVADATARNALAVLASDIGKAARQTGDSSFWVLTNNVGPVWKELTGIPTADFIDFNTAATPAGAVARLKWNANDGTLDLGAGGGNVTIQLGQEHLLRARNVTGATVLNGKAVKLVGSNAFRTTIAIAQADSDINSDTAIGILTEDIANNADGFVTMFGLVRDIDTSMFAEGARLYLSAAVAGALTTIAPSAPNKVIEIGLVVRSHATLGSILVTPTRRVPPKVIPIACSDEITALTAGVAKVTFRMPFAMSGVTVRASLTTAQATGLILTVDVNEGGVSILSTKLTIDNTEKTSVTAATPPVISDASLADDAEITIDIDQIGDGTAKGLKVYLIGN